MKVLLLRLTVLLTALVFAGIRGQMYGQSLAIYNNLLDRSVYKPEVIPVSNQSTILKVNVAFTLLSIVAVDDATQSFICNGVFHFYWDEERVRWDPRLYGGLTRIHPLPTEVWRPRVILINTLEDRDPFGDDISPVVVFSNGSVSWIPGSLFTTSCSMSLLKYPFDKQHCTMEMISMGFMADELEYRARTVMLDLYTVNGEWHLDNVNTVACIRHVDRILAPGFEIHFHIKRRPAFYVLTVILPFVILSFLNMLVFTIPQDSGEKIGYGITILLALSVFFSIIGGMLPKSSNIVPYIIIYLFTLYLLSVLAVIDSMAITILHHMEEGDAPQRRLMDTLGRLVKRFARMRKATIAKMSSSTAPIQSGTADTLTSDQLDEVHPIQKANEMEEKGEEKEKDEETRVGIEKYKVMAATLNFISCVAFLIIWVCVTLWFFLSVLN